MNSAFDVRSLTVCYPGATDPAVRELTLEIPRASLLAIIGPNGSGKSTLVRALLGAIPPTSGTVSFDGRAIHEWPRRDLARHVAAVAQHEEMPFPVAVRDLVAMGRYPHIGALRSERAQDRIAIDHAMQRCDVTAFAERSIDSLSGGERQRARIARALAQEPSVLVLDEPTVALDIAHEMSVFELLRTLVSKDGWTVIVATHHLNLAARYSDTLLLLAHGRAVMAGPPAHVMRREVLEPIYGWPILVHEHQGAGFDRGAPQISPLSKLDD